MPLFFKEVPVPKAVFVLNDNSEQEVEVGRYESLMRAAVRNNVEGIAGDCGGGLTCATCHVYVDPEWVARLPPPGAGEEEMLEFTAAERRFNSRLCCQLRMAEEFAGIRVSVPEFQY
jgi:2Fe-2S ferredoxin